MTLMGGLQTALATVYPARCLSCGEMVDSDFGLCGPCWRDTSFIGTTVCDGCGVPLPGDARGEALHCDNCLKAPRPWDHGRAALLYKDTGRKLVLSLKHGDRQEIAKPAALWMANAIRPFVTDQTLIAPVPLHWSRLLSRRYNQSALLAKALAEVLERPCCPDLLLRPKRTRSLDGLSGDERHEMLQDAITLNPKRRRRIIARPVLLVDDVLTSGATLGACAEALRESGAGGICVVTLARVAKDA